jgi:APA family basic amino acid/polyamine antiporter
LRSKWRFLRELALSAWETPCYSLRMSERDTGLLRTIGTRGLAANTINSVIGAGIFAVPGALAACIGPLAPLAFLVCGVAIGAVAICFAEGGSRMPTSGGPYGYIEPVFGPTAGFIAGTLLWLGNVLAGGGVVAALAEAAMSLVPPTFKAPVHAVVIVGVIGGVALVNLGGVARGARLVDWATAIKLIPLLIFLVAGVGAIHRANFVQTVAPSTQGLGRAMILALFVLTGMEVSLSASGEVKQPARTIPRALASASLCCTSRFRSLRREFWVLPFPNPRYLWRMQWRR